MYKNLYSYCKQITRQLRTQFVEGISVILKSTLRVAQHHWKRNHWTGHTRLPHIEDVLQKLKRLVGICYKIRYKLPDYCLRNIYFAFVYPIFYMVWKSMEILMYRIWTN